MKLDLWKKCGKLEKIVIVEKRIEKYGNENLKDKMIMC